MSKIRPIAFYLPQYHPIPENDEWWGKGFTEWTNVAKARPLFKGHDQPHLPADLGFYDLRVPEVREQQAEMARSYGIHGFCYYHYWFNGKRLLERPFHEVLTSGKPDFPFCLCWANENWTRAWDGHDEDSLVVQRYSPADDVKHIQSLIPAFKDSRYIRVNNKPLFLVYRSTSMPDSLETTNIWREEALKHGLDGLYLCRVESFGEQFAPASQGFDASIEFPPHLTCLGPPLYRGWKSQFLAKLHLLPKCFYNNRIYNYSQLVAASCQSRRPYTCYPCVTPSWDNSARKVSNALIARNSTPQVYAQWLKAKLSLFNPPSRHENLFFINAWNEWAEGNHLEPCQKWGDAYLEATKRAFIGVE